MKGHTLKTTCTQDPNVAEVLVEIDRTEKRQPRYHRIAKERYGGKDRELREESRAKKKEGSIDDSDRSLSKGREKENSSWKDRGNLKEKGNGLKAWSYGNKSEERDRRKNSREVEKGKLAEA